MKIDPVIRKRIQKVVGKIPHVESEAFEPFLATLKVNHPELGEALEQSIILPELGDPATSAKQREMRGAWLLRVKHFFFDRYDDLEQGYVLSKRKVILEGAGLFCALFLTLFLTNVIKPAAVKAQADSAVATIKSELGFGTRMASGMTATTLPDIPNQASDTTSRQSPQNQSTQDVQRANPSPLNQKQETSVTEPPPLKPSGIFSRDRTDGTNVYTSTANPTPSASDPFSRGAAITTSSLSVYTAGANAKTLSAHDRATATRSLSVYDGGAEDALSVYEPSSDQLQVPLNEDVAENPDGQDDPFASTLPLQSSTTIASDETGTPSELQPGTKINATLEIGVIAIGSEVTPVIARGKDGSVWQGKATLLETNRFMLEFSSAIVNGVQQAVTARAVAEDGFADLPAQVQETTPALASDLLRGSLRGVSHYVEDLGKQTTTVIDEFGKTITRTAPSLEHQILGSISDLFQPTTQQALVRVTELPAGTTFTIIVF
jgi:hypothetical protein